MFRTRIPIAAGVLLAAGFVGAGAVFWGSQRSTAQESKKKAEDQRALLRNKALSRLNLRKLGFAMHRYEKANKHFLPPPALINKNGKAVLSWRVLILPYLGERELYEQFKLAEPWDGPHNKKLLSKMPKVFAPPGIKTRQPFSTFYQVFVSPKPKGGNASGMPAAFMQGQQLRYPASFCDGTANTILIVEGGRAVPWTKPEDLPFAGEKPLPELGGLFPDVFHAVYANGEVHTLTKNYDDFALRGAINPNDALVVNYEVLEARLAATANIRQKNRQLQNLLELQREQLRLLREERDVLRGAAGEKHSTDSDAEEEELKKENARLRKELDKVKKEIQILDEAILRKKSR